MLGRSGAIGGHGPKEKQAWGAGAGEATNVSGFAAVLLSAFTCQVISSKRHNGKAILSNVEIYKTDLVLQVKSSIKFCRKQCNAPQETDVGRRTHKIISHGSEYSRICHCHEERLH